MLKYGIAAVVLGIGAVVFFNEYQSGRFAVGVRDDYERAIITCARDSAEGAKMIDLLERKMGKGGRPTDLEPDIQQCELAALKDRL